MLLSLLILQSAEGGLEEGEVFKWDGMTDCTQSEGWELAAPTVGTNGEVYAPPTLMADPVEDGGTPFCRFNGIDTYLAIKSTTHDPANPAEQTSVTHREYLTIAVWFRTSYTSDTHNGYDNWAFLDCDRSEKYVARPRPSNSCLAAEACSLPVALLPLIEMPLTARARSRPVCVLSSIAPSTSL